MALTVNADVFQMCGGPDDGAQTPLGTNLELFEHNVHGPVCMILKHFLCVCH